MHPEMLSRPSQYTTFSFLRMLQLSIMNRRSTKPRASTVICKSLDKDLVKLVLNNNVREVDARKASGRGVVLPSGAIAI